MRVYHGTNHSFDPRRPGVGQTFAFDNPVYLQGFWVTEDEDEARYYMEGPDARLLVYDLDISEGMDCDDETMDGWVDCPVSVILGAEGKDNHVVHDTKYLTFIEEVGMLDKQAITEGLQTAIDALAEVKAAHDLHSPEKQAVDLAHSMLVDAHYEIEWSGKYDKEGN